MKVPYDFKGVGLPGLTGFVWFAQGTGAIDPATGAAALDQWGLDLDLTCTFPGWLKGLQIKTRFALIDIEGPPASCPTSG